MYPKLLHKLQKVSGDAQQKDTGAIVSPQLGFDNASKKNLFGHGANFKEPSNVRFDIAVTVSEQSDGQGGASINVLGLRLGEDISSQDKNETVSRITFELPIIWPIAPR